VFILKMVSRVGAWDAVAAPETSRRLVLPLERVKASRGLVQKNIHYYNIDVNRDYGIVRTVWIGRVRGTQLANGIVQMALVKSSAIFSQTA